MIQRLEQQGRIMVESLLIETKNLTKSYGPHVALDDLNLSIPHGATGLLGPNGAGKSTFLKTMLGLIQVTSGEGSILGHDIRTEGEKIRSKIGYMPEYDALWAEMAASKDPAERAELAKALNDMAVENGMMIPLTHRGRISAHSKTLGGVVLNTFDSEIWNSADWYRIK